VQNIDPPTELHRCYHTVSIGGVSKSDLKDTTTDSSEPLGLLRHPAKLDKP